MNAAATPVVACTVCGSSELETALSFGPQPPANRFIPAGKADCIQDRHPLSLGRCLQCGTVQLVERMPIEAVRPRFDWLVYNEPEGHLDDVADRLAGLPGLAPDSRLMGVTYKDRSTLERMQKRGFGNVSCIAESTLGCLQSPFGLESIQDRLSRPEVIDDLRARHGQAALLMVRHITEHAVSASTLLRTLAQLVTPGGYLVLELPDSERVLRAGFHAFIWEEHLSYFTAESAARLVAETGFRLVSLSRYAYPYEDSLIVVIEVGNDARAGNEKPTVPTADDLLPGFARTFNLQRSEWHSRLSRLRQQGMPVAMFGAGHLSAKFINFFELSGLIECVIDDHPQKVGMHMPGSALPIIASSCLETGRIRHCISTLSPESESRVRLRLSRYFEQGGLFIPAFSAEPAGGGHG